MDVGHVAQTIHHILGDPALPGIQIVVSFISGGIALYRKRQSPPPTTHQLPSPSYKKFAYID
jgi:hypothetical protein